MIRNYMLLILAAALTIPAALLRAQQTPSLGAYARQQRELRQKEGAKPAKVYTNDNLPYNATISVSTAPAAPASKESAAQPAAGEAGLGKAEAAGGSKPAEDKKKKKEYWQEKFQAAYSAIASAEEYQSVAEDELSLLQTQHAQAQAVAPSLDAQLVEQIQAKQKQVDDAKTNTVKAKQKLEDLKAEFKDSGAPADWMPPAKATPSSGE